MVQLRKTDIYGTEAFVINDPNFSLPLVVENKLNIHALKNNGYGYLFVEIPMVTDLPIKMSIKLLSKDKFVSQVTNNSNEKQILLFFAENGVRIIMEEELVDLIEESIINWDKLLVLYGID